MTDRTEDRTNDNEQQDDTMNAGLGVAERDFLHQQLEALQDTPPPRAVWKRIEEQARAEGLFSSNRRVERLKWAAGAAIAATVAMVALNLQQGMDPAIDPTMDPEIVFSPTPTNVASGSLHDLDALKVESQILERNLRLLPSEPAVKKVSTTQTISDLEDQIAAIDFRLNDRTIKLEPRLEEMYWRERVRLMNLLVQLRSAQAQRTSF